MKSRAHPVNAADGRRLRGRTIFIRFVTFAILAGVSNLATQEAIIRLMPPWIPIIISVLAGTAIGFVVKYVLDKYYVFLDGYDGHTAELRKVAMYGLFSIGTTLLFWAIELGFWYAWSTAEAKYIGAIIGLILGNWLKYLLDRRWVFSRGSL
jgi:putative flippase GtrA